MSAYVFRVRTMAFCVYMVFRVCMFFRTRMFFFDLGFFQNAIDFAMFFALIQWARKPLQCLEVLD